MQLAEDVKSRLVSVLEKASRIGTSMALGAMCGIFLSDDAKRLEAFVLGVKYKAEVDDGGVKVLVEDPLNREEDSSRLFVYMLNAIERVFKGNIVKGDGRLISLAQLEGGQTAKLYERRIVNFLAAEMDGSTAEEVEVAAGKIGGSLVAHADATWSFEVRPFSGVRIRAVFWQGEEGIPSGAALLLGEEAKDMGVPIEELMVIVEMAVNRFVLFYRQATGKKPKLFNSLYI
ncbi:MAG: DUF3786 domain-containing protein [Nitrososphaerota archaeon]|nr:DUF3786 domain-containing protein [Candidatus Bathyarchaeota archaeon]MDW8023994.1 DUF3786 domain-containing protein [Nitrososphaerota archaeon]